MTGHTYGYILDLEPYGGTDGRANEMRRRYPSIEIVVETRDKNKSRPQWERLFERLHPGDTLVLENVYGLGFNFNTISDTIQQIRQIGDVCVVFLDMPLMSDRSADDPLNPMISELVSQTVLYLIDHQKRTREYLQRRGLDNAKSRGVHLGRPKMELSGESAETVQRWRDGEITAEEAAEHMNVSRSTFFRRMHGTAQETQEETV